MPKVRDARRGNPLRIFGLSSARREEGFWWYGGHPRAAQHRARRRRERAENVRVSRLRKYGRSRIRLVK